MQSITVVINRQPSIVREEKSQLDYFHSDDEEDSTRKPSSLSCLDLSPTKKDISDTKKRSVKKSISFGQKYHEGQRPAKRKSSKIKFKPSPKPLPDLREEVRKQKLPQRSTSHKTSSSEDEFVDLQEEFRRERRSRQSHNPRASSRTSSEALGDLREEFRIDRERRQRKSFNKRRSPKMIESSAPRPRRSSSVEVKSSDQEALIDAQRGRLRRSSSSTILDNGHQRRSVSRNYRKSPTPREWYQQLQRNEDSRVERPPVPRRSLSKNSNSPKVRESTRKSSKQDHDQPRRSLGRKSTSFRKKSTGPVEAQDELEATPLEWHQQLSRREDRQAERPRSKRSLRKSESLRNKSPKRLDSDSKDRKDERNDDHSQRRRRSNSARRSSSIRRSTKYPRRSRRSPTPKIPREFYIVEDNTERQSNRRWLGEKSSSFRRKKPQAQEDEEERSSSRRSLGKKSASASFRRRQHQYHEEEIAAEEERSNNRRSLGKKSLSFKRKNPPPFLGSRQDQDNLDDLQRRRKSLPQKSTSFPLKSTQPKRSLTPVKLSRRLSLGKKVSLLNIFGSKNEQSGKENKVDWKEWGFKECSYYQNSSNNDSTSSLKRKTSNTIRRLSSLTKLTSFSRKTEGAGLNNATSDDGLDSQVPENEKVPGPLRTWSAFRRALDATWISQEEEDDDISFKRPYEDISVHCCSTMRAKAA